MSARYYQPRKLDPGYAGIQATLIRDKTWLSLDNDTRLLYMIMLLVVDKYGNHDYDIDTIMGYFMADLRTGRITYDQLQERLDKLISADLIEIYEPHGYNKQRFHITNHKVAGDLNKISLPQGPIHPKQTVIGRSVRKQDQCTASVGQVSDTWGRSEETEEKRREEKSKKGDDFPLNHFTYLHTLTQGFDVPQSELAALALAYPALDLPATFDAFLQHHRDNPGGPQYPRDEVDAVGKLRGWCKRANDQAGKPRAKADPDEYLDAEGWTVAQLEQILEQAKPAGWPDAIAMIREYQPDALDDILSRHPEVSV